MSTTFKSLVFVSLLSISHWVWSANQTEKPLAYDYQDLLNELISEHIPGAVLYISSPKITFWSSAGVADIESRQLMPKNAVMPNGSAGKKLTALLAAMLHDEGKLDLDAPVSNYLSKDYLHQIEHSLKMTIRQLLNHTSGIFEYNDSADYAFFKAQFAAPNTLKTDEFPLGFALNQQAYFEPGTRYRYSNSGYALAGIMLKNILGEHPATAIRSKILQPLHMGSSYIKAVEAHSPDFISGYFVNDEDPDFPLPMNVPINMKPYMASIATMDAPLVSNAKDLATLLRAIVKENPVVNAKVRNTMIGEKHLVSSWGTRFYRNSELHYGLGVWREEIEGNRFFHHGGTEFGYFTQNIYIPDGDISITAFANCGVNEKCEDAFQDFTFEVLDSFLKIRSN